MAISKNTEPQGSIPPSLSEIDSVGGPIFEPFAWHTKDATLPENRDVAADVHRLDMAEDLDRVRT